MAPHSSTLAWKIPWMEEPGRLQSMGSQRVGHNWATSLSLFTGEGNGNPLQCSCLENLRDGGAWWAAVYGIAQSRTRLKWLSSSSSSSTYPWASLVVQRLKRLPAMRETWVSLGWEDPLEKEMATHSSILAWRIPWTEEPGGLQSTGSQSRTWLSNFTHSLSTYPLYCLFFFFFFRFFLNVEHFLKSLLNLLQYCFCFLFWFFGQEACGILGPWQGIKLALLDLGREVLTAGPPGTSLALYFLALKLGNRVIIWNPTFMSIE